MPIYSLDVLLSRFGTSLCTRSNSYYCFLTCIPISQEADQVVWYSHLLKSFPQFGLIHTVQGFDIVNKAKVDVFLELSCFFDDPMDVDNLISGSSAFSKSSLNIWKFMVHILLKTGLENFEHHFASMRDECNCAVVWAFFGIAFLWDWNEKWPFPVLCIFFFTSMLSISSCYPWATNTILIFMSTLYSSFEGLVKFHLWKLKGSYLLEVLLVAHSCSTLWDLRNCSPPNSCVHGILQQEYWSGVPLPSPSAHSYPFPKNRLISLNTD